VTAIVADVVETDVEGTPIVGGAAATQVDGDAEPEDDTPAARAAALNSGGGRESDDEDEDEDEDDGGTDDSSGRRGRLLLVIGLVVVLVVAAGVGTWLYARTQYYVGVAKDPTPTVGIYRGVKGSVIGVDLGSLDQRTDIPVSALPDFEQAHLRNGIDASSRNDARRIIAALRSDACPTPAPTPVSPAPPSGPSAPKPSAAPTATPTVPPTPTYCHD
jgi:PPM family protein phosphatase